MNKRPLFVALSNQKGGVGKSTMAVLLAGYFHYVAGKRVVVVDCDYPQYSVNGLRGRDVKNLEKSEMLQKMLYEQHERTGQKAYAVLTATAETAHETVEKYLAGTDEPVDIVFFDMPGTVNSKGVLKSIIHMDHMFTPIIQDRMVMQSSLSFVSAIQDFIGQHPDLPLRGIHLFWNRIDGRVSRNLYNLYNEVIRQLDLNVLKTVVPDTQRYNKEITAGSRHFFRSTLFPPSETLLKNSGLDALCKEVESIIYSPAE